MKTDGSYCVDVNGVRGKPFRKIFDLTISPNQQRVAYVGLGDGQSTVYIDGAERSYQDVVLNSLRFSPDSKRVAYFAIGDWQGGRRYLVLDGNDAAIGWDSTGKDAPQFSPDGKHIAYDVRLDYDPVLSHVDVPDYGQWFLIIDGHVIRSLDRPLSGRELQKFLAGWLRRTQDRPNHASLMCGPPFSMKTLDGESLQGQQRGFRSRTRNGQLAREDTLVSLTPGKHRISVGAFDPLTPRPSPWRISGIKDFELTVDAKPGAIYGIYATGDRPGLRLGPSEAGRATIVDLRDLFRVRKARSIEPQ